MHARFAAHIFLNCRKNLKIYFLTVTTPKDNVNRPKLVISPVVKSMKINVYCNSKINALQNVHANLKLKNYSQI